MSGFTTKAVHSTGDREAGHGALRPPVYESVAFEFEDSKTLERAFEGKHPAHSYSRITNPTVTEFEKRMIQLSGAKGVLALSSGMAAISNTIMAIAESGSNGVIANTLFGNTVSLFTETLGPWGLESRFVDMLNPQSVADAIDEKTRFIFLEVISNPQMEVADIKAICDIAKEKDVPVILDGTLTTPYLFDAKSAGVAVEILSSTKYISGGATSVGGLILDYGAYNWNKNSNLTKWYKQAGPFALLVRLRREVYRNIGACPTPHNAWLQMLGLETLALRVDRSCANALALAQFLSEQDEVVSVNYPGLKSDPYHELAAKQFPKGCGGLLSFELKSKEECFAFMDALKTIRRATNLNDNKSLIIHPSSTIFCEYSDEEKKEMRVSDSLIRLSVGIEDVEDLIEDIKKGFESL